MEITIGKDKNQTGSEKKYKGANKEQERMGARVISFDSKQPCFMAQIPKIVLFPFYMKRLLTNSEKQPEKVTATPENRRCSSISINFGFFIFASKEG